MSLPIVERPGPLPTPCWVWQQAIASNGYGVSWYRGRYCSAHRRVYQELVGPIPEGLQIDHLCDVRACVNPDHMRVCTSRENVLRSPIAPSAINARRTHCVNGHSLDDCYVRPDGRRRCRTCEQDRSREYQRAKRGGVAV